MTDDEQRDRPTAGQDPDDRRPDRPAAGQGPDDMRPDRPAADQGPDDMRLDRPSAGQNADGRRPTAGQEPDDRRPDRPAAGQDADVELPDRSVRAVTEPESGDGRPGRAGADAEAGDGRAVSGPGYSDPDVPLDPEAPLSADGPTVRLSSAMLPPRPPGDGAPVPDAAGSGEHGSEPAAGPVADGDEPTVVSRPAGGDDEATTALTPPPTGPADAAQDLAGAPAPAVVADEPAARDRVAAPAGDGGGSRSGAPAESPEAVKAAAGAEQPAPRRRLSSAGALIWVLLALLGFTLVVQLRSNDDDGGLATARQEDLVGILSDLEARDQRLQQEINALEESQRQLTSGVAGRQAALAEAGKRADELGLLSGTLPARGPGLRISIDPRGQPIKASAILNAVQELRGAGGEVMEIIGDNGVAVRIVASSYFVDAGDGQVIVDGKQLSGPYTLWVIGVPSTMQTALQIPGGVVASVSQAGGNVTMEQRSTVEVTAVRQPTSLQYARPVS